MKKDLTKLSSLSVVLPAYNDEQSLPLIIKKLQIVVPKIAHHFEIIIVDDASKDNTLSKLSQLKKTIPQLHVIKHKKNLGYGATLIDGFRVATNDFIFYTDSDGQYDVSEITQLHGVMDVQTDLVTGFKIARADSWYRVIIGKAYNYLSKWILHINIRDVDCDFRLFRKEILKNLNLNIQSGTFDAEFIKKVEMKNMRIKEIPIHHFPRRFGKSQFFTIPRVLQSLSDLGKLWFRFYRV